MKKRLGIWCAVLLLLTAACAPGEKGRGPAPRTDNGDGKQAVANEWVVKWKQREPDQAFLDTVQVLHDTGGESGGLRMLVRLKPGVDEERWQERWSVDEGVEYIHPNQKYKVEKEETAGNPFPSGDKYYLDRIGATKAWGSVRLPGGGKAVTVAVVDTGADLKHPFLKPWLTRGINLKDAGQSPQDTMGHGTRVAGVIAEVWDGFRKNRAEPPGSARIMPVKVMSDGRDGDVYFTAEGIREAVRKRADVVVLSQGSWTYSETMADAVRFAEKKGAVVVGAAGNAQLDDRGEILYNRPLYYPAAFPTVLGVASLDTDGRVAPTSNGGSGVDVAAPGEEIWAATMGGGFNGDSGTSFAAPQTAALAALILRQHPGMGAAEVRSLIRQTAEPVGEGRWNSLAGYGRINVYQALTQPLKRDIHEPNDSAEEATPFAPDQFYEGTLEGKRDRDCLRLDIPDAGNLTLSVHSRERKSLRLSAEMKGWKEAETYRGDELGDIRVSVPPEDVDVCLSSPSDRETPYTLDSRFRPEPDEYENNDHQWNARNMELAPGFSYVKGTLHKRGDDDWYRLKIPETGRLKVRVDVLTPRNDPVLYIQEQGSREGRKLDRKAEGEAESRTMDVRPGNLYVRVSDYGTNMIPNPYHLLLDYRPRSRDDFEPNDTSSEASLLGDGEPVKGRIADHGDLDWYTFFLKEGERPVIDLQSAGKEGAADVVLYDGNLRGLEGEKLGDGKGKSRLRPDLSPGTYFIRVRGEGRERPYQLRFSTE